MQQIVNRHLQRSRFVILFTAAFLPACTESYQSSTGGTLVIAATADAKTLFPPLVEGTQDRQIAEQIYDYLLVVGLDLNTLDLGGKFQPRLAKSWKWSGDSLSIAFAIDPRAKWHDGAPVDANDVRYTYTVYTHPAVGSASGEELKNIDSVTVAEPSTATFWYHARSSHQLLDASQMLIIPRHIFEKVQMHTLKEFGATTNPIGTGRFRFKEWKRGASVELVADSNNYRGRPALDRVIWSVAGNAATATTKLFGGEADVFAALRPENVPELAKHADLRIETMTGTDYAPMYLNLRRPVFASRDVRRALTMAIDRAAIVKNVYDTLALPAIGPTVRLFPTTDVATLKEIPFDPTRAGAILDSLGWTIDSKKGIRRKGATELAFNILVPSSSQPRIRMAVLLQDQLRRIGANVQVEQIDFQTFGTRLDTRDFDAAIVSWHLGATPNSVRESFGGEAGRSRTGNNYGAYENPRFDAELDSAIAARSLAESKRHFTTAYQIIIDDAPAIWLSEPKTVIGLNRRVKASSLRGDAWWFGLAEWRIQGGSEKNRQ